MDLLPLGLILELIPIQNHGQAAIVDLEIALGHDALAHFGEVGQDAALHLVVIHHFPGLVFIVGGEPHNARIARAGRREEIAQPGQAVADHAVIAGGEEVEFLDLLDGAEQ